MIHVCYGTQAEYIKLAPILRELAARGASHRIIDTGQHPRQTEALRELFDLRPPDVRLHTGSGIYSSGKALVWGMKILGSCLIGSRRFRREVFDSRPGLCVVHGDTLTTLLVSLLARMTRMKLAHVESGLRSFHWFSPFPEELIRVFANRRADLLFPPGEWACENLRRMKGKGRVVPLPANTGKDALEYVLALPASTVDLPRPYALASIHRFETVNSRTYTKRAVDTVTRAGERTKIIWPLHEVTRRALEKWALLEGLSRANVELRDTLPYAEFARLLAGSEFVIADGGSIQEESYFLNRPCLLLRHATERREGLDENVVLSRWRQGDIDAFLDNPRKHRRRSALPRQSPSAIVVDELLAMDDALS